MVSNYTSIDVMILELSFAPQPYASWTGIVSARGIRLYVWVGGCFFF